MVLYAPIEDTKTPAEFMARYKIAKRKLFPKVPPAIVKPVQLPVAVVHKPVEYTAEQAREFMAKAHTAIEFTATTVTPLSEIVQACCAAAGVTQVEFKSERRFKAIVAARQAFYYVARFHNASSYTVIGRFTGGKHHTTIMHGIEKAEAALKLPSSPLGRVVRTAMEILEGSK